MAASHVVWACKAQCTALVEGCEGKGCLLTNVVCSWGVQQARVRDCSDIPSALLVQMRGRDAICDAIRDSGYDPLSDCSVPCASPVLLLAACTP